MSLIKVIYIILSFLYVVVLSFHNKYLDTIHIHNNHYHKTDIYHKRIIKESFIKIYNNKNDNDLLSFGNTMKIQIKLPTRDLDLVNEFLNDPQYIVENTWDKNRIKKISSKTFLLQFLAIPIPGIDVVTPEIEVNFENINGENDFLL